MCASFSCSGELCPPGGYPCHHETLTNKRTRGKLVITNESLVFSKAGGIPELHDITYEVHLRIHPLNCVGSFGARVLPG